MAKSYVNFNKDVLEKGLTVHIKGIIKPQLLRVLKQAAELLMRSLDNDIPVYTGNLHDSTGVAIYDEGKLTSYIPRRIADPTYDMQRSGVNYEYIRDIVGSEYLDEAIKNASSRFTKGIWFVVFSTVPYAYYINEYASPKGRGLNFFNLAVEDVTHLILAGLRPIAESVTVTAGASL